MKRIVLALVLVCFVCTAVSASEFPGMHKLPFKEGVVTYALDGMIKGDNVVYVKDSGGTVASYRTETTEMMGMVDTLNELTITTPEWIYTADLDDKSGSKQLNPKKYVIEKFNALSSADQKKFIKNSKTLGITFMGEMSGDVEKDAAKIKGYTCDKVLFYGLESYVLSNTDFPMGISGKIMGMEMKETVTSVKKMSVEPAKFNLPAGIEFEHDEMGDQIVRESVDLMFISVLSGKKPVSPEQESMAEATEGMGKALEAMQQMQNADPQMLELQKQMMKLMEGSEAAN